MSSAEFYLHEKIKETSGISLHGHQNAFNNFRDIYRVISHAFSIFQIFLKRGDSEIVNAYIRACIFVGGIPNEELHPVCSTPNATGIVYLKSTWRSGSVQSYDISRDLTIW